MRVVRFRSLRRVVNTETTFAMRSTKVNLVFLLQVLFSVALATTAFGQAAPPKPMTEDEFVALLQARQQQVKDMTDLDDAGKASVTALYKQALVEMDAVKRWAAKAAQSVTLAAEAPNEIVRTKSELAGLPAQPTVTMRPEDTLLQVEQTTSRRQADLEKLRKELADDEEELKTRAARRARIPEQISEAKKPLAQINADLQAPSPSDEKPAVSFARRMILLAQRRRVEQEIVCREKELAAYEARTELLPLHHDLKARQIALAEQEIKLWQELANRRRQQEAEQQVQHASQEAGQAHSASVVRDLAETNVGLAAKRQPLGQAIADIRRQQEHVNQKLVAVRKQYQDITDRVKAAGSNNVTNEIGLFLRKQREALPSLREYSRAIELQRKTQSNENLTRLILINDQNSLNIDQSTQEWLKKSASQNEGSRAELEAAIRDSLNTQKGYLIALTGDYETYLTELGALIAAETTLIEETERCAQYIDERVLWIASAAPLSVNDVAPANEAFWWLAGPAAWLDLGRTLTADAGRNPVLSIFACCAFLVLFYWRFRFRPRIQEIGEKAAKGNCFRFPPTLETTVLTALAALVWPALTWYLGWRLTVTPEASDLCRALGPGLTETAKVFLALELLRLVCSPCGLGEAHFGWSASATKLLRHNLRWFSLPGLLLMCVAVTMAWQENDGWDAALGRASFMAALLCFSWALYRVLRPGGSVFQAMIVPRRGGWLDRFRYIWYPLCMLTPAALAVMAAVGYHYTARQLAIRLILTAYVVVGGIVARALLLRWTLVNQRRLAIEQAKQRRAAAQNEANAGDDAAELPASAVPERDLAAINTQTRRLVEYSLAVASVLVIWCAWVDVLPALTNANKEVWKTTVTITKEVRTSDGKDMKAESTEVLRSVKVGDLFLALIILATTVIAAKNIPGLLEMAVLQHLPFDAGARYAVATVCRYVITVAGLLFCCATMGIGWSKVQWLVAGMGVGLGFGLQEIFANFISGLIILFERPVRVGDVVTIDAVTGVVSRIRIRATTITDGDRKELIIPNKEFITGRVLNWTLTDQINRVVVNVGVAYGSDTQKAAEILTRIAQQHPIILDDPAPKVSLESFGDSSLNFVLRCFLPNMDNRGTVINDLHMAIDREFREAGIEMPFPQHDVHVRSIDIPQGVLPPGIVDHSASWPTTRESKTPGRAA
jgi:potassium-dependent mechanosensitive channel